jgi:1-acyl-sn-glycerol-3-phosphate acyltransferase
MIDFNRVWRWFGTAFSFFLFGLGGLLLTCLVFPLLAIYPMKEKGVKQQRMQKTVQLCFRLFIKCMSSLGVLSYEIIDADKLKDTKLILANHPSLLDVVFLISLVPNACCVVKGRLTKNIFLRGPIKAAGYIINSDSNTLIAASKESMSLGNALIIFPEGTRTTADSDLVFKRGAANIAIRCEAPVTPVVIRCTPTTLTKNDRWYQVPNKKVHFRIQVNEQLPIDYLSADIAVSKKVRQFNSDLKKYYTKELLKHEQ